MRKAHSMRERHAAPPVMSLLGFWRTNGENHIVKGSPGWSWKAKWLPWHPVKLMRWNNWLRSRATMKAVSGWMEEGRGSYTESRVSGNKAQRKPSICDGTTFSVARHRAAAGTRDRLGLTAALQAFVAYALYGLVLNRLCVQHQRYETSCFVTCWSLPVQWGQFSDKQGVLITSPV